MKSRTENVYARHQRSFIAWCDTQSLDPVTASPVTIATYLLKVISVSPGFATIGQICAALDRWFVEQGCDLPPTRSERVRRIRNRLSPGRGSIRLVGVELAQLIDGCPRTTGGLRDRALIALGVASRMKRAALASVTIENYRASGWSVPEMSEWLDVLDRAGITCGPVFRSIRKDGAIRPRGICPDWVTKIVKQRAAQAGIDPAFCSSESLRIAA